MSAFTHYKLLPTDNKNEEEHALVEFAGNDISLPDESKSRDDFMIGNGRFGSVFEVRVKVKEKENIVAKKAAYKSIKYNSLSNNEEQRNSAMVQLKREANLVNQMSHPNIIHLFGVCYDVSFFGIILELCEGGSLGNVCRSIKKLNTIALRVLANWAYQLSCGMMHLTNQKCIHGNLNAENVLVKEPVCFCNASETTLQEWCPNCNKCPLNKIMLKITGFRSLEAERSSGSTTVCLAPEQQLPNESNWSEFSDVWSFGVVIWVTLARKQPQEEYWISTDLPLPLKESWPQAWKDILRRCWSTESNNRPTFSSLVEYFEHYTSNLIEVHVSDIREEVAESFPSYDFKLKSKSFDNRKQFHAENLSVERTRKINVFYVISAVVMIMLFLTSIYFLFGSSEQLCAEGFEYDAKGLCQKKLPLKKPVKTCADGYTWLQSIENCYKVGFGFVRYEEALQQCVSENAHLVSIHSGEENEQLVSFYKEQLIKYFSSTRRFARTYLWLGLTYNSSLNTWNWSDGSAYDYSNKAPGAPLQTESLHWTVIAVETYSSEVKCNHYWKNVGSNNFFSFICQKRDDSIAEQPVNIVIPEKKVEEPRIIDGNLKNCSIGYTYYEKTGYCYKTGNRTVLFSEANQACLEEGAHLVSIHSREENYFVIDLALKSFQPGNIFIGLHYSEDEWKYTDKSPIDYTNWFDREPNNMYVKSSVIEDKVAIAINDLETTDPDYGKWNNQVAKQSSRFVCKKKAF